MLRQATLLAVEVVLDLVVLDLLAGGKSVRLLGIEPRHRPRTERGVPLPPTSVGPCVRGTVWSPISVVNNPTRRRGWGISLLEIYLPGQGGVTQVGDLAEFLSWLARD